MLFGWPAVCLFLFVQLPIEKAAIWSLIGGYLILPASASVDVALLPPLDKVSITSLSTFLCCWAKGGATHRSHTSLAIYVFAGLFVICPFFTCLTNRYELVLADRSLPGFYPLDAVKLALQNLLTLAPFFVGLRFSSSEKARVILVLSLIVAALLYSLPMLFELRMSPQLQRLIYGATSAAFGQQYRAGGYRPVVFLSNGLEVALFTSMALMAALVALRAKLRPVNLPASSLALYLAGLLLLCKTLGSILYASVTLPFLLFSKPKTWVRLSCALSIVICSYPFLRNYDLIPVRRVAAAANSFSAERSGSFQFRVENEDRLLAKANEKPLFGWGTWSRNRVYDRESGTDLTVTDGAWILRYGMFGWIGYLALFGLFAASIFTARKGVRGPVTRSTVILGGLTLILAMNLADLIPNANVTPLTFLMAGAIAGGTRKAAVRRTANVGFATKNLTEFSSAPTGRGELVSPL